MSLLKIVFVVTLVSGALAKLQLSDDDAVIMKQCENAGAQDKFAEVRNSTFRMKYCVNDLIDFNEVKNLFRSDSSKSNEYVKELFKNYCSKVSQLKTCIHNEISTLQPCFPDIFNENNSLDELLDYVCYNDGEIYSEFLAANGTKCFTNMLSNSGYPLCALNATKKIGELLAAGIQINDVPLNMLCSSFDSMTSCLTEKLRECESQTPANMFNAVMQISRRGSRCKDFPVNPVQDSKN